MISVSNLSKSFGGQHLFDDVGFVVSNKERIGLVGRNGTGKSTLFKIILGKESSDTGDIQIPKGYRLGSLEQHIHFTQPTVLEECIQYLPPSQQYDHFKAEKILSGLGFMEEDFHKDPNSFSGGYQVRINLTKALLQQPDMLLLDEPTNYLDIVSLRWLRNFLVNFDGEVLLITHDREFMDSVCTHVMGLNRKKLKKVKGNTEKYYQQIEQEEIIYEQTRMNQEKKAKEIQDFVDRFRAKASKAKQAQSRLKMLSRMEILAKSESEGDFGFRFHYSPIAAKTVGQVSDLSFGYNKDELLFENLKFTIGQHDRIAIVGKNGKGKSTLLNVMADNLKAVTGSVSYHQSVHLGHFGQTNIERLHLKNSIAQEIQEANPDLSITAVRNICGCMMFEGDKADKKISVLSGGERSRVMLGKILAKPANLLFLDEPTNHLDMESIEVLCDEIENFEGAVVLVTHSEMLLRRLANRLIIFRKDGAEYFYGSYEDFLEKIGWEEEEGNVTKKASKKLSHKDRKRLKSELVAKRSRDCGDLKDSIDLLESEIDQLEKLIEKFNQLIQDKSDRGEDALELMQQVGQMDKKIEDKFVLLEEAQLKHDQLWQEFENQILELE